MHFTIRRRRKAGEALHYKQSQTIRGRRYCVSNVKYPAAVKSASSNGFTHVLIGHNWKTMNVVHVALHGGHNAGEIKRTRPRTRAIPSNKSCASSRGVLRKPAAADLGSVVYRESPPGWHEANCVQGGADSGILACLCSSGHQGS